jgi:hypothetical protein
LNAPWPKINRKEAAAGRAKLNLRASAFKRLDMNDNRYLS